MKRSVVFVFAVVLLLANQVESTCIDYFYSPSCPHCAVTTPIIDNIVKNTKDLTVIRHSFSSWDSKDGQLLLSLFTYLHWTGARGVPTVYISPNTLLVGETEIKNKITSEISEHYSSVCFGTTANTTSSSSGSRLEISVTPSASLFVAVIILAFSSTLPPSVMSIMVSLFHGLLLNDNQNRYTKASGSSVQAVDLNDPMARFLKKRPRLFNSGVLFTLISMLFFFGLCLSLTLLVRVTTVAKWILKASAAIALIGGIFDLKSAYFHKLFNFNFDFPKTLKEQIVDYLETCSKPIAAVPFGFVASVLSLTYSAAPLQLASCLIAANNSSIFWDLILSGLFAIVFGLPLLFACISIYNDVTPDDIDDWRKTHIRMLFLLSAIGLIAFGIMAIFDDIVSNIF